MSDKKFSDDQFRKARDWFEDLMDRTPGLGAYRGLEKLRDQDKIIRENAVALFRRIKDQLENGKADLLNSGGLSLLGGLEALTSRLDKLINMHRFAAYGYSGVFDTERIEESELEELRRYDLTIVTKAGEFLTRLEVEGPFAAATLSERLSATRQIIDELESLVAGRRESFHKNFAGED